MENMEKHSEVKPIGADELQAEKFIDPLIDNEDVVVTDDSENFYPINSADADTASRNELITDDRVSAETSYSEPALQEDYDESEGELSPYPFALSANCVTTETWEFAIEVGNATDSVLESTVAPQGGPDRDSDEFNPDVVYDLVVEPGEFGSITVTDLPEAAWYEWTTGDTMLADFHGSMIDFSLCATTTDEELEQPAEQEELKESTEESSEETTETIEEQTEPPAMLLETGENIVLLLAFSAASVVAGAKMVWSQKANARRANQ